MAVLDLCSYSLVVDIEKLFSSVASENVLLTDAVVFAKLILGAFWYDNAGLPYLQFAQAVVLQGSLCKIC